MMSLGIFSVVPPTEPRALRYTQPLKVSTRDFSWGKGGRCVWLMTYHACSAETSRKSRALTYLEPLGSSRPVAGDLYFYFTFTCFGWFFRPSSELIKLYVQPWVLSCFPAVYCWCGWVGTEQFQPTHTSGRHQEGMTIRKAAHTVL